MRATRTMVLYVVYRASIESKGRITLPNRLNALGCQQLHRAFWKIDEKKAHRVLKVLANNQPILLKRLREIKNPQLVKKNEFAGLGSLIVVMFTLPKGANREKVNNFLNGHHVYVNAVLFTLFPRNIPFMIKNTKQIELKRKTRKYYVRIIVFYILL